MLSKQSSHFLNQGGPFPDMTLQHNRQNSLGFCHQLPVSGIFRMIIFARKLDELNFVHRIFHSYPSQDIHFNQQCISDIRFSNCKNPELMKKISSQSCNEAPHIHSPFKLQIRRLHQFYSLLVKGFPKPALRV